MKKIVALCLLLAIFTPISTTQGQSPPGWEIGWEDDEEILIFELDPENYAFELIIDFWIENTYPVPIDVDFESEIGRDGTDFGFQTDDPGKISVPGDSNESFELKISCSSSCELWSANNNFLTQIYFTATNYVAGQPQGDQEISKKIQPSSIYGFEVTFDPVSNGKGPQINVGTYEMIDVIVGLSGNANDAISEIDMSFRGCPQMNFDAKDSGLEAGVALSAESGVTKKGSVKLSAPSSHPDKKCTFVVTVTSEGNGNSYTGELEFNVDAPDASEGEDKENPSDTESSDFEVEDNSLPAISSILCLITVLLTAIIRR
jgi:hypothetical protein